jgi:hypothetical protein
LITNRRVFSKINFFIPADDFLDDINEFAKEFTEGYNQIIFHLFNQNQEYIAEVLTQWGLCFTYNIGFSHDLLHINSTSDDFHYIYSQKMFRKKYLILFPPPQNLPIKVSTSQNGLWVGFWNKIFPPVNPIEYDYDGYLLLFHNPFELPSKRSKLFKFSMKFQTTILIDPQINSIDETLLDYEPHE